jgi:hypothetical protein
MMHGAILNTDDLDNYCHITSTDDCLQLLSDINSVQTFVYR